MLAIRFMLIVVVATLVRAEPIPPPTPPPTDEPVLLGVGECSFEWVKKLPCEKYLYKGHVFVVSYKEDEVYRIDVVIDDELINLYRAPRTHRI